MATTRSKPAPTDQPNLPTGGAPATTPPKGPPPAPPPRGPTPPAPQQAARAPSRMDLANIGKSGGRRGWRMFLNGEPKIGKTTWAIDSEEPVFANLDDDPNTPQDRCFPRMATWRELLEAAHNLATTVHPFKTFVVDTIDRAELLAYEAVKMKAAKGAGTKGEVIYLGDVGGGFKQGNEALVEEFMVLLKLLDRLREKGINVILCGHAKQAKYTNPDGADFDMWAPKVDPKVAGLLVGWADIVAFAGRDVRVDKIGGGKKGGGRAKGGAMGARWLYLDRSKATHIAGNRYSLPARISLEYSTFAQAMKARQPQELEQLYASLRAKAGFLEGATFVGPDGVAQSYGDYVEWAILNKTAAQLARVDSHLAGKLQEIEEARADAEEEAGGEGDAGEAEVGAETDPPDPAGGGA